MNLRRRVAAVLLATASILGASTTAVVLTAAPAHATGGTCCGCHGN